MVDAVPDFPAFGVSPPAVAVAGVVAVDIGNHMAGLHAGFEKGGAGAGAGYVEVIGYLF